MAGSFLFPPSLLPPSLPAALPPPAHGGGPASRRGRRRQHGGMSVTMMLLLMGLVGMLGLVEIGFLYWAKRDVQKVADLAAMAGAQRLDLCSAGNDDNDAARGNATTDNRFGGGLEIRCGNWNPANAATDHFLDADPAPLNAVKVTAERGVLPFFGQNPRLPVVRAQAVATRAPPQAVFSVGSQLLRINGQTPLGNVLKLVGVDLDQATLLGYDGLAQATITLDGLLQTLPLDPPITANIGIGELNNRLATARVSLGDLLTATATLLEQGEFASIKLDALRGALDSTSIDISQPTIQLGSSEDSNGLFASITAPEGPASPALQTQVGVLDLISTGISIAGSQRAVDVQGLNILGAVQAQVAIIEPPSIGIGGVGTQAYNAQTRVFLDIDSDKLTALGPVLSSLGIRLHLPIYVDVANAMGTLQAIDCGVRPATATVQVQSSVLRTCVGKVAESERFSTRNVCDGTLQEERLLTLLGVGAIDDKIAISPLSDSQDLTLAAGETGSTRVNPLAVGATVDQLVDELLRVLGNLLDPSDAGMDRADTASQLAERYVQAANPGNGSYDVDRIIDLLRNGSASQGLEPLGDWQVDDGVPYACGLLGLATCFRDGSVWDGYRATVTGEGLGALDGLLGSLTGGLLINRCSGLVSVLTSYNQCVRNNLASYIQTAPEGLLDSFQGDGSVLDSGTDQVACNGLLCVLLKPTLELLKPILNGVGTLLSQTLAQVLGLELGRTDVHMHSIQCTPAQLVY